MQYFSTSDTVLFSDKNDYGTITSNNAKKEDNKMSIVGMIKTKGGIVAFGDSKSSMLYDDIRMPYTYMPITKKVFASSRLIIVTWGSNEYIPDMSGNRPLEAAIDEIIQISESPSDFAQKFKSFLFNKRADKNITYHFYIGWKDSEGDYCISEYAISSLRSDLIVLNYNDSFCWAGHDLFIASKIRCNPSWTLEQMCDVAKIFVESAIKLAEAAEGNVAPIGGPVQLETLV